jgi:hypothetical protein
MAAAAAARLAALLALLLAAPLPPAAAQSMLRATLELQVARAQNQFQWTIAALPPSPTTLTVPIGSAGTVSYSVKYQRVLLSTTLHVSLLFAALRRLRLRVPWKPGR